MFSLQTNGTINLKIAGGISAKHAEMQSPLLQILPMQWTAALGAGEVLRVGFRPASDLAGDTAEGALEPSPFPAC